MTYAPVLIMVYTRIQHFVECVNSLSTCPEAQYTTLFVSSDQGKDDAAKGKVEQIRQYCKTITGFARVEVLEWQTNIGGEKAYFQSVDKVFSEFDRMIYTEDDNVFAPNFLTYINSGLEYYKDNDRVFSICGYKHPFELPKSYNKNTFSSYIVAAWGVGHWREKYEKINFYPKENYWEERKKWPITLSLSWSELMENVFTKGIIYGDVIMGYWCMKQNMVNIYPAISLVRNKGNDGSGVNCANLNGFSTQQIGDNNQTFSFINDITPIKKILRGQKDAIDFPFVYNGKLLYLKIKRILLKYIRDFIVQRPAIKKIIKKIIS